MRRGESQLRNVGLATLFTVPAIVIGLLLEHFTKHGAFTFLVGAIWMSWYLRIKSEES
jgi:hypothetical protein